jgi:hypothetical protein
VGQLLFSLASQFCPGCADSVVLPFKKYGEVRGSAKPRFACALISIFDSLRREKKGEGLLYGGERKKKR